MIPFLPAQSFPLPLQLREVYAQPHPEKVSTNRFPYPSSSLSTSLLSRHLRLKKLTVPPPKAVTPSTASSQRHRSSNREFSAFCKAEVEGGAKVEAGRGLSWYQGGGGGTGLKWIFWIGWWQTLWRHLPPCPLTRSNQSWKLLLGNVIRKWMWIHGLDLSQGRGHSPNLQTSPPLNPALPSLWPNLIRSEPIQDYQGEQAHLVSQALSWDGERALVWLNTLP